MIKLLVEAEQIEMEAETEETEPVVDKDGVKWATYRLTGKKIITGKNMKITEL